jgi:uncharacterized membrane protein
MELVPALARWMHVLAGITWVGLLYYFNLVQMAGLKAAAADGTAAGINKHIAPRALLWFRWSAVVTWLGRPCSVRILLMRLPCGPVLS